MPNVDVFTIKNLPPGSYCVFAGPVMCMSAAKVDVVRGRQTTIQIPKVEFDGTPATVGVWTLDRKVKLQAKRYSVKELVELLTEKTESNPRFTADSSIGNEKLSFGEGQMPIWDVLEKLYLDKGWKVDEGAEKTLIIKPAEQTDLPVEGEGAGKSNNVKIQPLSFGPVVNGVVYAIDTEKNSFIDFDTGKYFNTPKKRWLLFDFDLRNLGHRIEWAKKTGADAAVRYSSGGRGLLVMLWSYGLAAKKVDPDNWQDLRAEQAVQYLSKATHFVEDDLGHGDIRQEPPDTTHIFKTLEGGVGIIQIVGFINNPMGVKIRYKMVQKAPARKTNMHVGV